MPISPLPAFTLSFTTLDYENTHYDFMLMVMILLIFFVLFQTEIPVNSDGSNLVFTMKSSQLFTE